MEWIKSSRGGTQRVEWNSSRGGAQRVEWNSSRGRTQRVEWYSKSRGETQRVERVEQYLRWVLESGVEQQQQRWDP